MAYPFRKPYQRRPIPPTAEQLTDWLSIELYAVQMAIAPPTVFTVTTATTLTQSAGLCLVDATAGAVTVTLPRADQARGQMVSVKKIDASGNAVTVDAMGGTIDGATTATLAARWDSVTIVSDGTNWYITATV